MRAHTNLFGGRRAAGKRKGSRPKRFKKKKSGSTQDERPKKWSPWAVLGCIGSFAVWGFAVYKIQRDSKVKDSNKVIHRDVDANRDVLKSLLLKPLVYTEHATCRMDCRFITKDNVEQSIKAGIMNPRKSDLSLQPCPKYVVDAQVGDQDKNIQTVFAACPDNTKVVTVIDRDTDWKCYCP